MLDDFPTARLATQLHRLSEYPAVWYFHGVDDLEHGRGGRFDLSKPQGTCHLAESLDGALLEKLLRKRSKVVVAERLRELFHARIAVRDHPPSADLTAPASTPWGINAEIHSTLDYAVTRRWAWAFYRAGWRALRYLLRGDATGRQAGVAVFGSDGLHRRAPAGMVTQAGPLDYTEAVKLLASRGVEVRPIPSRVPITEPPTA